MKKLVTSALAMIAGLAMAVDSQNVVGYQSVQATGGAYKMLGVTFSAVGETGTTLGSFIDQSTLSVSDIIMIPDASGAYLTYTYIDAETAEEEEIEGGAGWYDDDTVNANDVVLAVGSSVWFLPDATETIKVLGEVKTSWEKTVAGGKYTMMSFPFPKDYTLVSFTFEGTPGDVIMIPDASGVYASYSFIDAETSEEEELDGEGWYDEGGQKANAMSLTAGQGFWIYPESQATFSETLTL